MTEEIKALISEEDAISESETWLLQKVFNEVKEQVYQRGTFTVYIIHAVAAGHEYEGVGFGKARPDITISQYDSEKGKRIARGRAVHDLFVELGKSKGK